MLVRTLALSFTLLSVAACGSGSGSGSGSSKPMTPLTGEQKTKVKSVTDSMSSAQGAASQGRSKGLQGFGAERTSTSNGVAEKTRELGQQLQGNCQFDNTMPDGGSMGVGEFHINVGGPGCPIRMATSIRVNMGRSGNVMTSQADFKVSYAVTSPAFASLNDVTGIEMAGTLKGSGNDQDGGSASGKIEGAVQSQAHGKLPISVSLNQSGNRAGSTSTTVYTLAFPDFTGSGKVVEVSKAGQKPEITYFINDQKVTEQEFNDTFNRTFIM